ncbi:hypothetical protein [Endozoicomonas euniceicola]|uniref:Uncharacterized protein n=1 Tax=Endozoicomonas euniceicola TaxID=1234143 RepID=A0ABY6H032_9GAMM|nr:hypothetical protein [Endozoicomonas euniceicola]UYM18385.1 hypothetical protein NX720_10900 [Endozoicomonas euniceicola]
MTIILTADISHELRELSFAELFDYFIVECEEDEGMFSAIKVS